MNNTNSPNRIVVKVGTDTLTLPSGALSMDTMSSIATDINAVMQDGSTRIALVTSGAVAAGKMQLKNGEQINIPDDLQRRQLLAAIGQPRLMEYWGWAFEPQIVGQLLAIASTFDAESEIKNLRTTIDNFFSHGFVPVINANDTLTTEHLKTGDNDFNAAKVAEYIGANRLILCTNVDGLYDKNPNQHADARLINELPYQDLNEEYIDELCAGKSNGGTGGMRSKLQVARNLGQIGIDTYIIKTGVESRLRAALRNQEFTGTRILA
jgi:glutamate 5-kinase